MKTLYEKTAALAAYIMECGELPLLIGEAGTGKSQMVEVIANFLHRQHKQPIEVIEVPGSFAKEGDLPGIPFIQKEELQDERLVKYLPTMNEQGTVMTIKAQFAPHTALARIIANEAKGIRSVLFFDEVNRADRPTMNEIMQLALTRRIGSVNIPESTMIMAAGNPSAGDVDYATSSMDAAFLDRFFILNVLPDIESWQKHISERFIDGVHLKNNNIEIIDTFEEDPEFNPRQKKCSLEILEYLNNFPDFLLVKRANIVGEENRPTPRSWDQFMKIYEFLKKYISTDEDYQYYLVTAAQAKFGGDIAISLQRFLTENIHPLVDVKALFKGEIDLEESLKEIQNDSSIRQRMIASKMINILQAQVDKAITAAGKPVTKVSIPKDIGEIFARVIGVLNKDLYMGVMKELADKEHRVLLNSLVVINKTFQNEYLKTRMEIHDVVTKGAN